MSNLTASDFKAAYNQVTLQERDAIKANWWPPTAYTRIAKTLLMPKVAAVFGLNVFEELDRFDIVFCDGPEPRFDSVLVAVELENNITGSEGEIQKLSPLDIPLKVLITFATPRKIVEILVTYTEIALGNEEINNGRLLVVFGPYGKTLRENPEWTYYLYQNGHFDII